MIRKKKAAKKVKRVRQSRRRGLSRIDQPSKHTHGWFVRVGYHATKDGRYRPKHTRFFADASNGGKAKALKAAESFLDSLERKGKKKTKR